MAQVRVLSKAIVQPAKIHGEPITRIELTPWDLQLLLFGPIQKGLFFRKPLNLDERQFRNNVVDHLKTTFSRTLEFFYPLAGRLGVVVNEDDKTSSFFIDCNNKGAYFVHTTVDCVTVEDILNAVHTPRIVYSFFAMNGKLNIEGNTNPLLAVQVNELVDGFFIGCTMNHAAVDGSSFWHFMNSWAEISRGSENISILPVFKRWFPTETDFPIRIPSSMCSYRDDKFELPLFKERVFHFPKEKIGKLKAIANTEMNTATISSLQALMAHLWQSVIGSQKIDNNHEVKYMLIIGARQRLQSSVPQCYFGNAVMFADVSTTAADLLRMGLGEIASRLHQVISLQTSDVIMNNYKTWADNPMLLKMNRVFRNMLVTSSSPRFDMYGADFGWGKPLAVRSGSANKSDGKITLFAGAEEGSIDIEVCLSPEKLIALENCKEFTKDVTIEK